MFCKARSCTLLYVLRSRALATSQAQSAPSAATARQNTPIAPVRPQEMPIGSERPCLAVREKTLGGRVTTARAPPPTDAGSGGSQRTRLLQPKHTLGGPPSSVASSRQAMRAPWSSKQKPGRSVQRWCCVGGGDPTPPPTTPPTIKMRGRFRRHRERHYSFLFYCAFLP